MRPIIMKMMQVLTPRQKSPSIAPLCSHQWTAYCHRMSARGNMAEACSIAGSLACMHNSRRCLACLHAVHPMSPMCHTQTGCSRITSNTAYNTHLTMMYIICLLNPRSQDTKTAHSLETRPVLGLRSCCVSGASSRTRRSRSDQRQGLQGASQHHRLHSRAGGVTTGAPA